MTGVGFTSPTFGMVLTPLVDLGSVEPDLRFFFITKNAISPTTTINATTATTIPAIAAVSRPPKMYNTLQQVSHLPSQTNFTLILI